MAINYTPNVDGRFFKAWELDPSTRDSIRLLTKPYPVDSTLAVAGTAEDLITVSPGLATVNLITNPSCETGSPPTGYSAVASATLTSSTVVALYGAKSLKIEPPDTVKGEGAYWDLGVIPANIPLALSVYVQDNVDSGDDARIELVASTTPDSNITNARILVGNTITLTSAWQRSKLLSAAGDVNRRTMMVLDISGVTGTFEEDETITGGTSGATAVVRTIGSNYLVVDHQHSATVFSPDSGLPATETITGGSSSATATVNNVRRLVLDNCNFHLRVVTATKHGTAFYADGFQAETLDTVTAYCDGSQGAYHWWDGTANASTSRRWPKLKCIRAMRLHTTKDIYLGYDKDANSSGTNAEDRGEYIPAGTDFGCSGIFLDSKLSFVNAVSGEKPRVYGVVWGI